MSRQDSGVCRLVVVGIVRGRIFYFIGCKMMAKPKVEASHGVESWVAGTHSRGYFPQRAEAFLHSSFSDGE